MQIYDLRKELLTNILPYEGEVYYLGSILTKNEADYFFEQLFKKISWKPDEARIFGKHIFTKRKIAWYADQPFSYTKYPNALAASFTPNKKNNATSNKPNFSHYCLICAS